jgi:Flp pilus assembly protein TadG
MTTERGAAIMEFALAWPVALLIVLGSVQLAVWGAETYAARSAALAGARAGTAANQSPQAVTALVVRTLAPSLVGSRPGAWCPGRGGNPPAVWVCVTDSDGTVQVDVGGTAPALVPLLPGGGMPLRAHVVMRKEVYGR